MATLEGRLALVTGGGSGIGRAICQLLDREGARVAVADLNLTGAQETANMLKNPSNHLAVHMDVASKESVTKGIDAARRAFGAPPSLLANCAGYIEFIRLEDLQEKDFDRMIDVHLKGSFLVVQALAKDLKIAGTKQGSFVLISSIAVHATPMTMGHYSAAKAGVIALAKTFAKELSADGIRVNTVVPGIIDTPIWTMVSKEDILAKRLPQLSVKRLGRPEEVAEVVVFLLSKRSSYVTGAEYRVDGGFA